MIVAPDETYSTAEAADVLEKSERQVLRYLTNGQLRGSKASGRWTVTALRIWEFRGIADVMLENWRTYCRLEDVDQEIQQNQCDTESGE